MRYIALRPLSLSETRMYGRVQILLAEEAVSDENFEVVNEMTMDSKAHSETVEG